MKYKVKSLHDLDGNTVLRSMPLDKGHWPQEPRVFQNDAVEDENMVVHTLVFEFRLAITDH